MKKGILLALRVAIGVIIILFLLFKLDIKDILHVLTSASPVILIYILAHFYFNVFFNAIILRILLRSIDTKIGFSAVFKWYLISYSIGMFFPGKLGEFSLPVFLKRKGIDYGKGLSVMTLSKFIVVVAVTILSVVGLIFLFSVTDSIKVGLIALAVLLISVVLISNQRVRGFITKNILRKHAAKFTGFFKNIKYMVSKQTHIVALSLLLVIVRMFVTGFFVYLYFLALGVKVPFIIVPLINAIALLISLIPISISGLGLKETSVVFLYSLLGVEPVLSGSMQLSLTFFYYIIAGAIILAKFDKIVLKEEKK